MGISNWVPATITTFLLSAALYFLRNVIKAWLNESVQHEFDKKLENLRSVYRKNEEAFKSDLQEKTAQIVALQSGAISGLVSRQAALDKRRIEAVEQLWSAVTRLASAKGASIAMSRFRFKETAQATAENPELREAFEILDKTYNIQNKNIGENYSHKARPFISQFAWALYSAYEAIVMHGLLQLQMLKTGANMPQILATEKVAELIEVALPHQSEYIKKYGDSAYSFLLDELESGLLRELQNILQGKESDKETVEQTNAILKAVDAIKEKEAEGRASAPGGSDAR